MTYIEFPSKVISQENVGKVCQVKAQGFLEWCEAEIVKENVNTVVAKVNPETVHPIDKNANREKSGMVMVRKVDCIF